VEGENVNIEYINPFTGREGKEDSCGGGPSKVKTRRKKGKDLKIWDVLIRGNMGEKVQRCRGNDLL